MIHIGIKWLIPNIVITTYEVIKESISNNIHKDLEKYLIFISPYNVLYLSLMIFTCSILRTQNKNFLRILQYLIKIQVLILLALNDRNKLCILIFSLNIAIQENLLGDDNSLHKIASMN